MTDRITKRIRVYGIVQGVGFRPTVSRHAMETGVTGTVCNKGPYVEIFAQGTPEQVDAFLIALEERPPRRAAILKIDAKDADDVPVFASFEIIESEKTKGEIFVSPDIAICEDCKHELYDPKDRRYLHPFINCTCCGPRLTILDALPYDRERTSMKEFPMCPACASEYYDPKTRRYDAQPVCCNDCGPEVYMLGSGERGRTAITKTRRTIASGGVVAIKGIGGFHLCCDATSSAAVHLLRDRKQRPAKPFAVMMRDMDAVRKECEVPRVAEEILTGHQKPILLLKRKESGSVCEEVAPENPKLGVMLPYAPVQLLLFDYDDDVVMPDCLVMTSGNISGAPICRDDEEALRELGHLCDGILSHNRRIRIRADDSVMDLFKNQPYMIRRSRGYAPLPYLLSGGYDGKVLAIGGELKNSFCIGSSDMFYPSPYVGDLEDLRTVKALQETVDRFQTLLEVEPQLVACDLHPKYNSTVVAEGCGLPIVRVQHHYAHVLSCMAENDHSDSVIGVSFDGTGYGTDGTIWGGEILRCDYRGFERLGHIAPFQQPGGDLSAKEGFRVAVAMIHQATGNRVQSLELIQKLTLCEETQAKLLLGMLQTGMNTIQSTSAGRLFDAVSAMLGIRTVSTFEGEAATALQFHAERAAEKTALLISEPIRKENGKLILATDRLFSELLKRRLNEEDVDHLAWAFHDTLAELIVRACVEARLSTGIQTVALTGGVYQNTLLLERTLLRLREQGFHILQHHLLPPNDGGVGLGQAVYAMQYLQDHKTQEDQ